MVETVYMKRGDLMPDLVLALWNGEDESTRTAVEGLTGASSIVFIMRNRAGVKIDRQAMTLDAPVDGVQNRVRMPWPAGSTDTAGDYDGEVEVVWPGEKPQTFPVRRKIKVKIEGDLG